MDKPIKPSPFIAISQVISVILVYIIVSIVVNFIVSFIQALDKLFPILSLFTANKFQEFMSCTLLPALIAGLLCLFIDLVYKKYYFHIVSTIILFMLASWLIVQDLITKLTYYGLFSYSILTQLWFDAILFIPVAITIFKKTAPLNNSEKTN